MLWIALSVMTAAAVALLVVPMWRARRGLATRGALGIEVYRDQLGDLERDLDRGLLSAEEADAARLEIERRLLAAADDRAGAGALTVRWRGLGAAIVALALPAAGLGLYPWLGSPGLPSQPYAEHIERVRAEPEAAQDNPQLAQMIAGLAARLEDAPDDLEGWTMLGRSYGVLGRYREAAAAFRRAVALDAGDPELLVAEGESLVFASDGVVTPAAETAFRRALVLTPGHPAPRYYLGLAERQAGNARAALERWLALAADSAEEAPWRPILLRGLEEVAQELDVDLASVLPPAPMAAMARGPDQPAVAEEGPGPSEEEVRAAARVSPEEREATIRGMVERLAARLAEEPDDLEGWLRLGRARQVLGEFEAAREAYGRAAALAPDDARVLAAYGTAITRAAGAQAPVSEEALRLFERVLALDAGNAEALWFTGLAAAESDRAADAANAWQRLLERLAPDDPAYAEVAQRLEALKAVE